MAALFGDQDAGAARGRRARQRIREGEVFVVGALDDHLGRGDIRQGRGAIVVVDGHRELRLQLLGQLEAIGGAEGVQAAEVGQHLAGRRRGAGQDQFGAGKGTILEMGIGRHGKNGRHGAQRVAEDAVQLAQAAGDQSDGLAELEHARSFLFALDRQGVMRRSVESNGPEAGLGQCLGQQRQVPGPAAPTVAQQHGPALSPAVAGQVPILETDSEAFGLLQGVHFAGAWWQERRRAEQCDQGRIFARFFHHPSEYTTSMST